MDELKLTVEQILKLMDKMAETGLGKMEIEDDGYRFSLSAKKENIIRSLDLQQQAVVTGGADGLSQIYASRETAQIYTADDVNKEKAPEISGNVIEAPIVGTFYNAPAPDKKPFVEVGQRVSKGDVLFIIESMKLMNEVQSELDGEVKEILIENETPVEFGQPIMIIK